jgi:hypothetical protein
MKWILFAVFALLMLVPVAAEAIQATVTIPVQTVDPLRTGIRFEMQTGGTGPFVQQGAIRTPDTTTFNVQGLALSTQYMFRLVPVGDLGDGPVFGPQGGTPGVPSGLSGTMTIIFSQ